MQKPITAPELASEFCHVLNEWLDEGKIDEINRLNKLPEYSGSCASHDFCDANQAMLDAMAKFGMDYTSDENELINTAWALAIANELRLADEGSASLSESK